MKILGNVKIETKESGAGQLFDSILSSNCFDQNYFVGVIY